MPAPVPAANGLRGGYVDVDSLDDASEDGHIRAVISQRRGHNRYTCAFFKVFLRDGEEERTAFFEPKHFDGLLRLIPKVRARINELETQVASPNRR